MANIFSLKGVVKHYDWGGTRFIPQLLNIVNESAKPFAEYWLGVHPAGTAQITKGSEEKPLSEEVTELPFLLKILDVHKMLSIQVHPTIAGAEEGFANEEEAGVPLDAPHRNYKDKNHKPELMLALSDFWLLHGFKAPEPLFETLNNIAELNFLLPIFNKQGYEGLYRHIMEMPQAQVNSHIQPLINSFDTLYKEDLPSKFSEDYWAMKALRDFEMGENIDRGIFSIYIMNLVYLKKGEAIFQGAGVPHAYLEGKNVEIMANSDNVLRGGLTLKHIDVAELLKHVMCEPTYPNIILGKNLSTQQKDFPVPVPDFHLQEMVLEQGEEITVPTTKDEIVLVLEGEVTLQTPQEQLRLSATNRTAFVKAPVATTFKALQRSKIFRAY